MTPPILARSLIEPLDMQSLFSKLATLCFATFCLTTVASAQGRIPGEFIVRFDGDVDASKWGEAFGLEHARTLSQRAQIHLFELPTSMSPADDWAMLRSLRKDDRLVAAQFNHEVQPRETTPDDPALNQQWHHVQNGDHDIDSDLAWDITTGGQTADGTRIVVAVLEGGGANYSHVDLIDNHWVMGEGVYAGEPCMVYTYKGTRSCRVFSEDLRPIFMVKAF